MTDVTVLARPHRTVFADQTSPLLQPQQHDESGCEETRSQTRPSVVNGLTASERDAASATNSSAIVDVGGHVQLRSF